MAVVSVNERFQQRRSSLRDGVISHTREWIVVCDDPTDGTAVALSANDNTTAIPPEGTTHYKDGNAKVTGLEAQPHEQSDRIFLVTAEYTGSGEIGLIVSPLDRPPEISYNFTDATEPYFLDCSQPDPRPVVNSAGDAFEAFFERETGDLTITITVNEADFDVLAMDDLKHTTNNAIAHIDKKNYAIGVLKLSPPSAQKVKERVESNGAIEDFTYYKVTYVVKAKKSGWKDEPLDNGFNELLPGETPDKPKRLRPIVDSANLPIKKPWPLNGTGIKKTDPTMTPEKRSFLPYYVADWSNLKPFKESTWE